MRLPDHIYQAIKEPFAHHAPWHAARRPENGRLRGPGTAFPELKALNEPGCGEQFLRFHRHMMRQFKWVVDNTPGPTYPYQPWDRLPPWLNEMFDDWPLEETYADIDRLVKEGAADDLGNFIEATDVGTGLQTGSDIHNVAHGLTHLYEIRTVGEDDPRLVDAGMNNPLTAHHNEHFWALHGWIDNVFAEWQTEHGETVDQSPLPPHDSDHAHMLEPGGPLLKLTAEEQAWRFPTRPKWAVD